jgi:hypothetical protein
MYVMPQAQYDSLVEAEGANLPSPPSSLEDAVVLIASIIVQEGQTNIIQILDNRPVIGFKASGVSASANHGNLLGLSGDDHPQYLLANGDRSMSGDLDMGSNNISNVGTVDGVNISTHASRHLPNGADPLTTASPTTISDSSNSAGVANSFSRSDHVHAHGNRGGGTLHSAVTQSVNGFMSSSDKTKLDKFNQAWLQYSNSAQQSTTAPTTSFSLVVLDTNRDSFPNSLMTKTSSTVFTANFNGYVEISVKVALQQTTTNNERAADVIVLKNGAVEEWAKMKGTSQNDASRYSSVSGTFTFSVSSGDTFSLAFRNGEPGASNTITIFSEEAVMSVKLLRVN